MKILLKILLFILRLLLKIARILSLKKLELLLADFLRKNESQLKEATKADRKSFRREKQPTLVTGKFTRNIERLDSDETEEKDKKQTASVTSPNFFDDDIKPGSKAMPIIVTAAAVAGAGIGAALFMKRDKKPQDKDLSEVEFESSDTYEKLFTDGFKKGLETPYTAEQSTVSTEGKKKSPMLEWLDKLFDSSSDEEAFKQHIIPESEYLKYAAVSRPGQSMDNLLAKYAYDNRKQAIGITTPTGTSTRKINEIILHCTATPEGREVSLQELHRWHVDRGFIGIGYHFVIHIDGTIEAARPLYMVGAHCLGHNANSIGISYVGGVIGKDKPKDTRTPVQKRQIWNLVLYLLKYFPSATVHGHYEYAAKACPCFNVQKEWKELMFGNSRQGEVKQYGDVTTRTTTSSQYISDEHNQQVTKSVVKTNGG